MATIIPLHRDPLPLAHERPHKNAASAKAAPRMAVADHGPWLALSMPFSLAIVLALVCWLARVSL